MSNLGLQQVRNEEIYLPDGRVMNVVELQAARAVEAYDSSLILGQLHGQWTVFVRNGPIEGNPFPVLGLGFELPSPDEITRKLHTSDTRRHGGKIAERVDRQNRERQRQRRAAGDQKVGEVAETYDTALRLMKQHPTPRIFVPGQ
jgi:hypothetical protein